MIYVKINDVLYPASVAGKMKDKEWDDRPSKSITMEGMTYEEAINTWVEGAAWSIVQDNVISEMQVDEDGNVIVDELGNPVMVESTITEEYDNSDYSVAGPITDNRNGTIVVKMGKLTELECALELLLASEL